VTEGPSPEGNSGFGSQLNGRSASMEFSTQNSQKYSQKVAFLHRISSGDCLMSHCRILYNPVAFSLLFRPHESR